MPSKNEINNLIKNWILPFLELAIVIYMVYFYLPESCITCFKQQCCQCIDTINYINTTNITNSIPQFP